MRKTDTQYKETYLCFDIKSNYKNYNTQYLTVIVFDRTLHFLT